MTPHSNDPATKTPPVSGQNPTEVRVGLEGRDETRVREIRGREERVQVEGEIVRGHVRKRRTWEFIMDVGVHPVTGRRRQKSKSGFATKKDAESALHDFIRHVEGGGDPCPERIRLANYLPGCRSPMTSKLIFGAPARSIFARKCRATGRPLATAYSAPADLWHPCPGLSPQSRAGHDTTAFPSRPLFQGGYPVPGRKRRATPPSTWRGRCCSPMRAFNAMSPATWTGIAYCSTFS